jgi:photosystem II stability/assembly factor-like uncharacterized protein
MFDVGRIDSLRGEWLAGTLMSKYDNKVIYHGLQHLYRSADGGETWNRISADLSYNDKSRMGIYPYLIYHQAITSISEGQNAGLIYTGTDDGRVWRCDNAGFDDRRWTEITKGLPVNKHVIKIVASVYDPRRVYVVLNDRRQDNHTPYIYVSENYGMTWKNLANNLPKSPVNVLIEDPDRRDVLYCGTDMGVYMSRDKGKNWIAINGSMPATISVNDMFIHPRDKKLVLGTYGRGVYVLDDISRLR